MNERDAVLDQAASFHDADSTNQLPTSADATGEISLEDVIEVIALKKKAVVAEPATPLADPTMSSVFGAITPKKLREVLAPLRASPSALDPNARPAPPPPPNPLSLVAHASAAPAPSPEPVEVASPTSESAPSYAGEPVAYDVPAPPVASSGGRSRSLLESTAELRWFSQSPRRIPWQHVVSGFAGAITLSILALFVASRMVTVGPASTSAREEVGTSKASAAAPVAAVITNVPDDAVQAPQSAALPAVTVLQSITLPPATSTVDALPGVPEAAPVPTHPASKTSSVAMAKPKVKKTGQLTMPAGINAALVDGAPKRVVNGSLTLTCGPHKIKLPGRAARTASVPCGGVGSL